MKEIFEGYELPKKTETPAHHFQEQALSFIQDFNIDSKHTGSIMKHFKNKPDVAAAAHSYMKDHSYNDPAMYFFKLMQ